MKNHYHLTIAQDPVQNLVHIDIDLKKIKKREDIEVDPLHSHPPLRAIDIIEIIGIVIVKNHIIIEVKDLDQILSPQNIPTRKKLKKGKKKAKKNKRSKKIKQILNKKNFLEF